MNSFRNPRFANPQPVLAPLFRTLLPIVAAIAIFPAVALAQGTQLWTQSHAADLEKGTPLGVSVGSDGVLRRGPLSTLLHTTPSTFAWAIAAGKNGAVFVGTGSPASVLRLSADGKTAATLLTTKALAVQALAFGPDGALYAATMPDGKVFRIDPAANSPLDAAATKPIFDLAAAIASPGAAKEAKSSTQAHYIWAMTFDKAGRLYLATGGPGIVYRLDPSHPEQPATRFFTTDEQHIRSLAWDKDGNLIAGSDGSGLVYRISPAGKGYVLFAAPRREITSLAVDPAGTIWAADVGEKSRRPLPALPISSSNPVITITFNQPGSVQAANTSSTLPDGTEIFALTPNAAPRKVWEGHDEIVYDMASTPEGLLTATGNQGKILLIQPDGGERDLAHVDAQQAMALRASDDGWLIATANPGEVYRLADGGATSEHAYASSVFDAGALARWGRVEVDPDSSGYHLFTRSGNVEQPIRRQSDWGWSDWKPLDGRQIASSPGRYLQWKSVLDPRGHLSGVSVNYLPVNAAPEVDAIVVVPGARYTPQPQSSSSQTVSISFQPGDGSSDGSSSSNSPLQAQKDKSAVTVRWAAHDDNGDTLAYDLYLRGDREHVWRLLKRNLTERAWSFNSDTIPDGGYRVRVVASDRPSHTPADALTGEMISDRFVVDTTPPVISELHAGPVIADCTAADAARMTPASNPSNHCIAVTWDAQDAISPIARAQYSIDAGPWQYAEPVGKLSDARTEHYALSIPLPEHSDPTAEHLIAVRVFDRYDNASVARAVVPAVEPKP